MTRQKLTIVKVGGNIIDDLKATQIFLDKFSQLKENKILIHGGGKIATQIAERLGLETVMVEGRRITDEPMLEVVVMVYGGLVNKKLVAKLQSLNCNAIGLTGADAQCILAKKREKGSIDYGFAGDIEKVNATQFNFFLNNNLTPVIAPLTADKNGQLLNTNADTMASAIAVALAPIYEVNLIFCFEKRGVLMDPDNEDSIIKTINKPSYIDLKNKGIISKGMVPKLENAFQAIEQGVSKVIICHAENLLNNIGTSLTL